MEPSRAWEKEYFHFKVTLGDFLAYGPFRGKADSKQYEGFFALTMLRCVVGGIFGKRDSLCGRCLE